MWPLILQPLFQALCTEDYDRFSPTKQNLLCNGQSVLESILSNEDFLHQALNNQAGNKTLELGIQVPPPRFAYALAKKTLSIILVLDLRYVLMSYGLLSFLARLSENNQIFSIKRQ